MFAEIISVGDEVLAGMTINTNAAYISKKLREIGFKVKRQTAIADDHEVIMETFSESLACVPLVIATGGLGPTLDDKTRQAAAELFESSFRFDENLAEVLKKRLGNFKTLEDQATVPSKALVLPNSLGTAPGLIFYNGQSTLILLPGVPVEMQELLDQQVIPYLKKIFKITSHPFQKLLHFANLFESEVDPKLRELQNTFKNLHIGIYPNNGLLTILLEGKENEVEAGVNVLEMLCGEKRYEASDGKIENAILSLFTQKKLTLSIAESCTGGACSKRLTSVAGASSYFSGGVISYSNELKESFLHVPPNLLNEKGAVSKEVAIAMVDGMQKVAKSDVAIAITGIAGPSGGNSEKPVGMVFIAIKIGSKEGRVLTLHAHGSREMIIERAVNAALGELYLNVLKASHKER